jgi:hypothetical protein
MVALRRESDFGMVATEFEAVFVVRQRFDLFFACPLRGSDGCGSGETESEANQ